MFLVYNQKHNKIQLLADYDFRYNLHDDEKVEVIRHVEPAEELKVSRVELRFDLHKYLKQQQRKLQDALEETAKRKKTIKQTKSLIKEAQDWQTQHAKVKQKKKKLETS